MTRYTADQFLHCLSVLLLQPGAGSLWNLYFFGVYGFSAKALIGVGAWLGGVILDLIEFPTNAVPGTVAEETLVNLALAMGPFCAIGGLASLVFLLWYRIPKARHQQTLAELVKRRST